MGHDTYYLNNEFQCQTVHPYCFYALKSTSLFSDSLGRKWNRLPEDEFTLRVTALALIYFNKHMEQ